MHKVGSNTVFSQAVIDNERSRLVMFWEKIKEFPLYFWLFTAYFVLAFVGLIILAVVGSIAQLPLPPIAAVIGALYGLLLMSIIFRNLDYWRERR